MRNTALAVTNPQATAKLIDRKRDALLAMGRRLVAELCPHHCWFCDARGMTFQDLCQSCGNDLPRIERSCRSCGIELAVGDQCGHCLQYPPPWVQALVPLRYELPVDYLVQRFKYAGDQGAGRLCGSLLAEALAPGTVGTVLPMPMHRKRYIQRGFNHAEVLARDVARAHGLRMEKTATRVRHTDPQVGLSARERRRNVRNAFAVKAAREPGQSLVLVDDIYTTGESLMALARAGRTAGYGAITVLCLARAELGRSAL